MAARPEVRPALRSSRHLNGGGRRCACNRGRWRRGGATLDGSEALLERREPLVELLPQPCDFIAQCLRGSVLPGPGGGRLGERWPRTQTPQRQRPAKKVQCFHWIHSGSQTVHDQLDGNTAPSIPPSVGMKGTDPNWA
jgi:hypothetical protein